MKIYNSQDMREVAKCILCSEVCLNFDKRDIAAMLRQAADMMEREERRESVHNRVMEVINACDVSSWPSAVLAVARARQIVEHGDE